MSVPLTSLGNRKLMVKEDQCWWRSQSISAVSHPAEALSTLIYKVHSQTRLLPASWRGPVLSYPFSWMLHMSHLIKNELKCKGQLRNHLPHEAIHNSWARKSSRHLFSACIAFLPRINSKCVLSHLFWELEALSSGSCLLLCLLSHWGQCHLCSEMHMACTYWVFV